MRKTMKELLHEDLALMGILTRRGVNDDLAATFVGVLRAEGPDVTQPVPVGLTHGVSVLVYSRMSPEERAHIDAILDAAERRQIAA